MSVVAAMSDDATSTNHGDEAKQCIDVLRLSSFRNHCYSEIHCAGQSVLLTGPNGAGKTNVLEALSLLSPGRGFRKASLGTLSDINQPASHWAVSVSAHGRMGAVDIGTGKNPNSETNSRIIKIDGEGVRGQHHLAQHLSILWQTPQMDGLFLDSGSVRRRFLDRLVYNVDADHAARVSAYEHAMRERTKLLQSYQPDTKWLDVLEQRMAEQGVGIAAARNDMVARLNAAIAQSQTSFPRAMLSLQGAAEEALLHEDSAIDVELRLRDELAARRQKDGYAGRATHGTHRTELVVMHQEKQMEAALCSTGEQKAMLMSMLLAHARARKQWQGAAPILLLDEVVAHLDVQRRQELFNEINRLGVQVWLTGTDAADFSAAENSLQHFTVNSGEISSA